MELDAGTFLVQWAAGGLGFLWLTVRRREVGVGYGWLLRSIDLVLAAAGGVLLARDGHTAAAVGAFLVAASAAVALAVTIARRAAGAAGQIVALDLVAPVLGALTLLESARSAGGGYALAAARLVVGAAFLGSITDAMLLGHWYLVQPGLRRDALQQLVRACLWLWPVEVIVLLLPTGMVSVIDGSIDDGYNGLLGWVWIASAVSTVALVYVTRLALRERYYSAVMSATGLLYLAILTAFGTDLIARATLA